MHAMMAIRDLPKRQREAWRVLFNHYVFDADESVYEHIPENGRGCLAPMSPAEAIRLKQEITQKLNH